MFPINDYLDDILEEFEDYVHSGIRLCDLKSVHFDAGKIPDYSNIHVQQLYLLRYAYAYSFQYKCMYRTLLDRTNFCYFHWVRKYAGLLGTRECRPSVM